MNQNQLNAFRFQFITHQTDKYNYLQSAQMALEGGCKWIQLRMKDAGTDEIRHVASPLKSLCKGYDAVFLLDDHVELCKEIGADGVHLGKLDMHPQEARRILGENFIIGSTCNTYEEICENSTYPIDYIGLGPFRFTSTKKQLAPVLGLDGFSQIIACCRRNGIEVPVVAIGGITGNDILPILQTGVNGIALSNAVLQAENPVKETERILKEIKRLNK